MKCTALVLTSFFFVAGCATGPLFKDAPAPTDGKALIYLYRMPNFALSGVDARFWVNGKKVCQLSADGYCYLLVPAGDYTITAIWPIREAPETPFHVHVRGGDTRYFRLATEDTSAVPNMEYFHWQITNMPLDQAHLEIGERHFQPAEIPDGEL